MTQRLELGQIKGLIHKKRAIVPLGKITLWLAH